jgi:hypothetical protein
MLACLSFLFAALALDDGLCRTPVMGMNSWTAFGSLVTAKDLTNVGEFFVSSGLRDVGYKWVNTDDGWDKKSRGADGRLQPDLLKFPKGIKGLVADLNAMNLSFGIYTAESSVVCSGRPGTLFYETLDAQTFADWGVGLVKNDNCGEYSYGNARFHAFADAVAKTGSKMIISTEPFTLTPNPNQGRFAHYWRTGNDIGANWNIILNRIDRNDKWSAFAGPGHFNDPDMLQVGNGHLTLAEQRSHFGLWAITKATLILGSNVPKLSPDQLAIISNKDIIAINQDPLGKQAKKVAINGTLTPQFVGLAPCYLYEADARYPDGVPGPNGVTKNGMVFHTRLATAGDNVKGNTTAYSLVANETGRCIGLRTHIEGRLVPMLLKCDSLDQTQFWTFPTGSDRIGAIQSLWAVAKGSDDTVLAVANSTLFGAPHKAGEQPLLDGAYGDQWLQLAAYHPEPACDNRNCQDYDPTQSWYWSPRSGTVRLAAANGNGYHCFEPGCYQLTSHLPAYDELCLARVASISNYGVDPSSDSTGGTDVYASPLAGGAYTFGLLNRGAETATVNATWSMLELPGFGDSTAACVKELHSGETQQATGGVSWPVASHDIAIFRVVPGSQTC